MQSRILPLLSAILLTACCLPWTGTAEESTTRNVLVCNRVGKKAVSAAPVVTGNGSYSLAFWVRITAADMERYTADGYLAGQNGDSIGIFYVTYSYETKEFNFKRRTDWKVFTIASCPAPEDNQWHFLTAVYDKDNGVVQLWLDGTLVSEVADTKTITLAAKPFSLGYTEWTSIFIGAMAEVSLWSKALNASDIAALMQARPTTFADCLGYWPLDDNPGSETARDITANNQALTMPGHTSIDFQSVGDFPPFEAPTIITYPLLVPFPQDRVQVTFSGADPIDGKYPDGSEVTLSASAPDGAEFLGWCGDVADSDRLSQTIQVTVSKSLIVTPVFQFDWFYDPTTKTISDGYWFLNATSGDNGLSISTPSSSTICDLSGYPLMPLLDLTKPIADGDATAHSIYSILSGALVDNPNLVTVRLPNGLKRLEGSWSNGANRGPFANCANLETVEPLVPESVEFIGASTFNTCPKLKGDLRFGFAQTATFYTNQYAHGAYFAGTAIGSATFGPALSNISCSAFSKVTTLTNVTFEGVLNEIGAGTFSGCTGIRQFTLPFRPPNIAATAFGSWNNYQAQFFIDPTDSGWAEFMASAENFTPWRELSEEIQTQYAKNFPNGVHPLGLSLSLPANQWLVANRKPATVLLLR